MHECPYCGMACDCDGEDTWLDAPDNCACQCWEEDHEDDGLYDPEEWPDLAAVPLPLFSSMAERSAPR